ncbi:MAG: SH3 domain protein [Sulfurimonas sp.]|jgi:SH3 domain protein|uniref:TIGR04211 family SH3 domain-containing protein n=1 Tax=Sulfurimonas sp. TaxID=2022749 RepID=UPI0039E2346E
MMRKTTLLLLVILSITSSASAATRYISDDLYTYIHSGPGTKYKIIGSVNSGKQIKVIQTNKNAGFTQIKDSKGRDGWINSKYISIQPSLKERLAKLEIQFTKLGTQLHTAEDKANKDIARLEDNLKSHSAQVRELKNTNATLNEKLQQVQALNNNLNEKLDTEKNDLLMRWFSYGGIVGGIGLLLGLILPSLIPRPRKKSRW